jgi:uncharacterized membrane protein YbhN (UPF0104 family)
MAIVVFFTARKVLSTWDPIRGVAAHLSPDWAIIAVSCVLVLAAYAVLVSVWQAVLGAWNARLPFWDAAHIWTVSNLGRYVPGKVWQLGAMVLMVQRRGISKVAGASSALAIMLVSVITGFVVVAVTGASVLQIPRIALAAIWIGSATILLALPVSLSMVGRLLTRLTGRSLLLPRLAPSIVVRAVVGTAVAWCLYGAAFQLLTKALLGSAPGGTELYISIFTGSYLIGFLALFAPGGLVVREGIMQVALANAGFPAGDAIVLVVASRLWLTVLEILPAVLFLLVQALRDRLRSADSNGT